MDSSKIGSARQQDDNRIAVLDAIRLGDCWQELSAIFDRAEVEPSDDCPGQLETYGHLRGGDDNPEARQWIKTCIMQEKAVRVLKSAIASGHLKIWRIHAAQEVGFAPDELENDNIKYSVFKSSERPEPDMQGADLWVKSAHWAAFLATLEDAPSLKKSGGKVPPNRQLDHEEISRHAAAMLAEQPGLSKGSAAASIVADLAPNPKSGLPRDARHIERIILHLWEGGL